MKSIVYFGFAANPPHLGHLNAIMWLASRYDLVYVGPSYKHAFEKQMQSFECRFKWTELLLLGKNLQNVIITDVEKQLGETNNGAPVYSFDVLTKLKESHPGDSILLAVGPDNAVAEVWKKFHNVEQIEELFGKVEIPEITDCVRSTFIRCLIKDNKLSEMYKYTSKEVADDIIHNSGELKW